MARVPEGSSSPDLSLSRAGSLPQWIDGVLRFCAQPNPLWERACSRWRRHIQHRCKLTHRLREQARSHTGSVVNTNLATVRDPCGSGLARDEAGTFNINAN
ncbi:hypothetical protein C0J56_10990 [Pseudomonas fluorescens]|nr:hypothetical protein C0J56_10990 [Pseudomonas fluorescens]